MGSGDKGAEVLRTIKHDIKNQLSNVNLAIAQLKHDMENAPEDQLEYLEMIAQAVAKIDAILNSTD